MSNLKMFRIRKEGSDRFNTLFAKDKAKAEMKLKMLIQSKQMFTVPVKQPVVQPVRVMPPMVRRAMAKKATAKIPTAKRATVKRR